MKIFIRTLYVVVLLIVTAHVNAQIISTGHVAEETTSYPSHSSSDQIFLYSDMLSGSLSATEFAGGTSVTYTWYTYSTSGWSEIQSGSESALTSTLEENGYRVSVLDNGSLVEDYYCWVFQPEILSAEIGVTSHDCTDLVQQVTTTIKSLYYYDLTSGVVVELDYSMSYAWQSSPSGDIDGNTEAEPSIDSPVEDTNYSVIVTAFDGALTMTADEDIVAIAVEAAFTFSASDRGNDNEVQDLDSYEGSAPVNVSLDSDASQGNLLEYEWEYFLDDAEEAYDRDYDTNANVVFEEYGTYYIKLTVNNSTCENDTTSDDIEVKEMYVDAANFFTPDGDGINEKFYVVYYSVKSFKMTIVNRWGRKVFSTTDPGDSWNGKIGGRKAAEGVYFYYIEAKGYNEGESEEVKGPLHLIRGN